MKRTRLKNEFIKYRCEGNKRVYNAQRNLCFSDKKGQKKIPLIILTSQTFLEIVKPFFTDKGMNDDNIILKEYDAMISENEQISESLNNFSADVITNWNISQYGDLTIYTHGIDDPALTAIEKYKNHPRIKLIKTNNEIRMLVFVFWKFWQLKLKKN